MKNKTIWIIVIAAALLVCLAVAASLGKGGSAGEPATDSQQTEQTAAVPEEATPSEASANDAQKEPEAEETKDVTEIDIVEPSETPEETQDPGSQPDGGDGEDIEIIIPDGMEIGGLDD